MIHVLLVNLPVDSFISEVAQKHLFPRLKTRRIHSRLDQMYSLLAVCLSFLSIHFQSKNVVGST